MSRGWCNGLTIGKWKLPGTHVKSLIWTPKFNTANVGCERGGLKGFRVNEHSSWAISQNHSLVATKSILTFGYINEGIMSRIKEVIILCYSALVCSVQASHLKGDVNKSIHREKVVRAVRELANPERGLSTVSKSLLGSRGRGSCRFVLCMTLKVLRSNGWKSGESKFGFDIRKILFFFLFYNEHNKSFSSWFQPLEVLVQFITNSFKNRADKRS